MSIPRATLLDPLTSREIFELGERDQWRYTSLVLGNEVAAPFRYRALVPAVARGIPDALVGQLSRRARLSPGRMAATKLVLLNALLLLLTAVTLDRLLRIWGLARAERLIGTLVFFLCPPVVAAASAPVLDVPSWLSVTACLLLVLERRPLALAGAFALGIFAKESVQVVVPLTLVAAVPWRDRRRALAAYLPGLALYYALRLGVWSPEPPMQALQQAALGYFAAHGDLPASGAIAAQLRAYAGVVGALLRPNAIAGLVLGSFGPLWLLAAWGWRAPGVPATLRRWALLVPFVLVLMIHYGAAHGRVLFLTAPVVLAFALYGARRWLVPEGAAAAAAETWGDRSSPLDNREKQPHSPLGNREERGWPRPTAATCSRARSTCSC